MIFFLIFFLFDLKEIISGIEKNPYFVSNFSQTCEISPNNFIKENGEIIFNFKKGIRFNYKEPEEKSFIIIEEGFYSKEKDGEWNFTPWQKENEEYKFFILLIKGEPIEEDKVKIEKTKKEYIIYSKDPEFTLFIENKNFFPLKFILKSKDGSINTFEFKNHKKILKEVML